MHTMQQRPATADLQDLIDVDEHNDEHADELGDDERDYPIDPELGANADILLGQITGANAWNPDTFAGAAWRYENICDTFDRLLDQADSYGTNYTEESVDDTRKGLARVKAALAEVERHPDLLESIRAAVRADVEVRQARADDDEHTVIAGIRTQPGLLDTPSSDPLRTLLRQIGGPRRATDSLIAEIPGWLRRHLNLSTPLSGIWIDDTVDDPDTSDATLEIARALWDPRNDGPYRHLQAALQAARRLDG